MALLSLSFLRSPSVPMTFLYLLPGGRFPGDSRCNHGKLNMFNEAIGRCIYLSGESRVGEALPTAGRIRRATNRELVLALGGVDEVVGGVPWSCSDLKH